MDLFKFLKKKQVDSIESLLQKAASDPAYRVEFIKRIPNEKLVFISNSDLSTDGYIKLQENTKIQVLTLSDGRIPLFTSKERIFDKGIVKNQVKFIEAKAEDIFSFLKGATLVLNPYSDYGKEFHPQEVERILNGTYFTDGKTEITVEKKTEVMIGQPAKYPTEIINALIKLFNDRPEVNAAYLGWIHNPASDEPPHYIFGIDANGTWDDISSETGFIVKQFLPQDDIIDLVPIHKNDTFLGGYFTKSTKPFYLKL